MRAVIGSVVCAALLIAGPAAAQTSTDKTLDSRIEKSIHSDASLKKFNIDVSVDGGVATLTGTVATEADRGKAESLAKVNGITRVDNRIVVDLSAGTTKGTSGAIKEGAKTAGEKTAAGAKKVGEATKDGAVKVGDEVTDAYLISKLNADFVNEDLLKGSDINVDSDNQIVTLKGTVVTSAGRARAVAIAKGTKGVKRVVDHLTIGPKK
jgi:osmotically-inducible protein OsmY